MAALFLIPAPLGNINKDAEPAQCTGIDLGRCRHFIVENIRTARRSLRHMGYTASFDETVFFELNGHTPEESIASYLKPIAEGYDVGLMSEAGVPCIADPGARIVAIAREQGIRVVPLVGPCSIILGLMASGFNGQNFAFLGYLPFDTRQRQETLTRMEQGIFRHDQTQILIETPYRNDRLLAELASKMPKETLICVACDLTLPTESVTTLPARQWLENPPDLNHHYCVFLLYKTLH